MSCLTQTSSLVLLAVPLLALSACAPDDSREDDSGAATSQTSQTGGDTDAQTDSGTDTEPSDDTGGMSAAVPECEGETPFSAEACGRALKELCRAQPSEQECALQGPFVLADGDFTFVCGWAKVIAFSDPTACTVESVMGRCEAGFLPGDLACQDACDFETGQDINKSLTAIASEAELVEMPCAPGGYAIRGPVGEWTALANQEEGDERHTHSCGADVPPPPALCDCSAAACEAGS